MRKTSTRPTPVVRPTPDTCAVYVPGARVTSIAASFELSEASAPAPTVANAAFSSAVPPQLSFVPITALPWYRYSCGSFSPSVTPRGISVGPTPRISRVFGALPVITKPRIRMLLSVPTCVRAEMFTTSAPVAALSAS